MRTISLFIFTLVVMIAASTTVEVEADNDLAAMLAFVSDIQFCNDSSWTAKNPVCQWQGVTCDSTNASVVKFVWSNQECYGSGIFLSKLPSRIEYLDMSSSNLGGYRVNSSLLNAPDSLRFLNLAGNYELDCLLDLANLPASLTYLNLNEMNGIKGTLTLAALPASLQNLYLSSTGLTPATVVDFTKLPSGLYYLDLAQSGISGTINLSKLPTNIQWVNLKYTGVCGTMVMNAMCGVVVELPDGCNCTLPGTAVCPSC